MSSAGVQADPALRGCTGPDCGRQQTVTVDGVNGRRCIRHLPPGAERLVDTYDRGQALALVDAGDPSSAFAWLRAHLTRRATA